MEQSELIERMAAGEGFGGTAPECIMTHISAVFLTSDRAYKMKRAFRTEYLDYETLTAREACCRREVELNRRTAPELYLGVVPIRLGRDGHVSVGDEDTTKEGEILDWAVEMRRFDPAHQFDRMAATGTLQRDHLIALADAIARFHADTPPAGMEIAPDDHIAHVLGAIRGEFERWLSEPSDLTAARRLDALCRQRLEDVRSGLRARGNAGRIKRLHGDLHLGNICLWDGKPMLFDAIEFSERIGTVDTFYDLGFLLMDLLHNGRPVDANAVFNRYLFRSGDLLSLEVMPLFLAMRAAIRGHVAAMVAAQAEGATKRAAALTETRSYLDLGLDVIAPADPCLIAVAGPSGSGKSTVARALAPHLRPAPGAVHLNSDLIRKRFAGVEPIERLPPEAYTEESGKAVYDRLMADAATALSAGSSVVADATFLQPEEQARLAGVAEQAGVRFTGIWLTADPAALEARVAARTGDASDATVSVMRSQLEGLRPPADGWRQVDALRATDEIVAEVLTAR